MVVNCQGMRLATSLSFLGLFLTLACSPPSDIGNPCIMRTADGGILAPPTSPGDDQIISGTTECQNLICLRPANAGLDAGVGFCSNALCTPDNGTLNTASQDCNSSTTGLVCNTLTVNQSFIKEIDAEDGGAALLAQYLDSTYCTTPSDGGS
jgi:hypothetical protein